MLKLTFRKKSGKNIVSRERLQKKGKGRKNREAAAESVVAREVSGLGGIWGP